MKKLRLFLISGMLFLFGMAQAQATEYTVPSGEPIQPYIDAAAPGDVIILVDGGIYYETLEIFQSITIKAVDGYTVRPAVIQGGTNGIRYVGSKSGAHIIIKGIEFESIGARYLNRVDGGDSIGYLEMTDVVAHGYDRSFIRASDSGTFLDSLLVDNCLIYNFGADDQSYRFFYFDKNDTPIRYAKLVNSSFIEFNRVFMQFNSDNTVKDIIIDHCTIHGRHSNSDDDLFDLDGLEGSSFKLTNSIISGMGATKIWDVKSEVADTVSNCYWWDIEVPGNMTSNTWSSETLFTEADPMYSNPDAGALYLDFLSPALTAATDGGVIGDPRWATPPTNTASFFTLAAIELTQNERVTLTPLLAADVYTYDLFVPYGTDTVEFVYETNFATATVAGDTKVFVPAGGVAKQFQITNDFDQQIYTINISWLPPSDDAELGDLTVSDGTDMLTLTPGFDGQIFDYTVYVYNGTDSIFTVAETNFDGATATITNDTLDVQTAGGVITVDVLAQDAITTLTYTVTTKFVDKAELVAYWTLDSLSNIKEEIAGSIGDSIGSGIDSIAGIVGGAVDFTNAVDTAVIIVEDSDATDALNMTDGSFSVSLLAKFDIDSVGESTLFMKGDNGTDGPLGNGNRYALKTKDGELSFAIDDNVDKTQLDVRPILNAPGEWAHIVCVRDVADDSLYIYFNGLKVASTNDITGALNVDGQRLLIGNYHTKDELFKGALDEIQVFNKAMSAGQVLGMATEYGVENVLAYSIYVMGADSVTSINIGDTLQMLADVNPGNVTLDSISWSVDDVSIATIDAVTGVLTAVDGGTVKVIVSTADGSGVVGTADIIVEKSTVGIDKISKSEITMYFDAISDQLNIYQSSKVERVEIFSITGAVLNTVKVHNQESLIINTQSLRTGIYIVRMRLSDNGMQVEKFIK